jgi:hypothetical protein
VCRFSMSLLVRLLLRSLARGCVFSRSLLYVCVCEDTSVQTALLPALRLYHGAVEAVLRRY